MHIPVMLHMTRVAKGVTRPEDLDAYLHWHWHGDGPVVTTRYGPTRRDEIAGKGSLFWVVKHQLVARSPVLAFGEADGGRVAIHLSPELIRVQPRPKRAHQGWRYLEAADVPPDFTDAADGMADMPPELMSRLAAAGLF